MYREILAGLSLAKKTMPVTSKQPERTESEQVQSTPESSVRRICIGGEKQFERFCQTANFDSWPKRQWEGGRYRSCQSLNKRGTRRYLSHEIKFKQTLKNSRYEAVFRSIDSSVCVLTAILLRKFQQDFLITIVIICMCMIRK